MKRILSICLAGCCAALLAAAGIGQTWSAETAYPPPYVVDANGKVVGHYDSSSVLLRIPEGPLVSLQTHADTGFLKLPTDRETIFFSFTSHDCTGERYVPYYNNPPHAFVNSTTKNIVYPVGRPQFLAVYSYIEATNGRAVCKRATGNSSFLARAAAYPLDSLNFTPPFQVALELPETAVLPTASSPIEAEQKPAQGLFPPPWVVDAAGKVVGHLTNNSILMHIPGGPLVLRRFYGPTGFELPPSINTTEMLYVYWTGEHCTGDQYLQALAGASYAVYDKVKKTLVYPDGPLKPFLAHSQTIYADGVVQTPCSGFAFGQYIVGATAKSYPVDALGFTPPFRIKLK